MGIIYIAYRIARQAFSNLNEPDNPTVTPSMSLHNAPSWLLILIAFTCLVMAAAASGMTLGYMSLDTVGLEIISRSGGSAEASAARAILPVREQGNLLLVTLLLTNTVATELLPLVLEVLHPGGYFSFVTSVVSLILFGEIIPQAICSRHALEIGAGMIKLVKVLRLIAYPLAAPIAFLLDKCLGQELGTIYSRDELKGLIDVHSRSKYGVLTDDETTILKGTLEFSQKTVSDVLTPAEDVYMLDVETTLDRPILLEMLRRGHSRIPLYEGNRNNVVCLLLLKQLVLIDPGDEMPIRALISNKKRSHKIRVSPALHCSRDALLSDALNEFQRGRSHMAIVYDDISKPDSEKTVIGIVTIEDIIEEILQEEIIDETDVFVSNVSKEPVLTRGPDGKLHRSVVKTAPYLVAPTRMPGTKTIVLKEIDVESLKQPLIATILADKGEDVKRQLMPSSEKRSKNSYLGKRKGRRSSKISIIELPPDINRKLTADAPDGGEPDGMSRDLKASESVELDTEEGESPVSSLSKVPLHGSGKSDSFTWSNAVVKRRSSLGNKSLSRVIDESNESSTLLPGSAPSLNRSEYGTAHVSLDMSSFPEIAPESEDERDGWEPSGSSSVLPITDESG